MKINLSVLLAALLALSLFSCKKELPEDLIATESEQIAEARTALRTPEEVNFFEFSYLTLANPNIKRELSFRNGADELVTATMHQILLQNATHNFVPKLIERFGYPI